MIKRLDNIKLGIIESEDKLLAIARKKLAGLKQFKILKKSLDARDKNNIFWVYSIAFSDGEPLSPSKHFERLNNPPKVAVIGSGPAGLFCALGLLRHGMRPVIIERGEPVERRRETITDFFQNRKLNINSNVQFGEGGAGAFSDGKLNTQTNAGFNRDVLELFCMFGAPGEIAYLNKPHIGSDNLYKVLQNIRKYIAENGGEYRFNTQFVGFECKNEDIRAIKLRNTVTGEQSLEEVDCVVLALGHSARDTFEMLANAGVQMVPRDFAVGVRIEHLSSQIGLSQYGKNYTLLPTADYKLVSHAGERTAFTFCMCPGGVVIPAASEEGGVVTNGMSLYARDGQNSNSALLVQMRKDDFGEGLFAGMNFQRELERKAFIAGGKTYAAPVQLFKDFAQNKVSQSFGQIQPTYAAGTNFAPLNEILPEIAVKTLKAAIRDMGRRLKGFDCPDALLTGVETRFSSPVRILRGESGESVSYKGLYPCGEGSGYSGGITSSAADGIKVAEKIYEIYENV